MRGKVTDIDLTNYALNELPPEERLYVESMLGVSEECRNDVYQMLELSEMLKDGYEIQEQQALLTLDESQRSKVLTISRWNFRALLRQAAAIALLATGIGYSILHPDFWQRGATAQKLLTAGEAVGYFVVDVHEKGFAKTADEFTARIQNSKPAANKEWQFAAAPAVCTPTSWDSTASVPDISEM
jgi:hypothetical protein